jgi:hypothetical protein
MGIKSDYLLYHHQFFAMTRDAMDEVVDDEARIVNQVRQSHAVAKRLGYGFCTDELWLNFLNQSTRLSRLVYFKSVDDRGAVNPPLTRHIRRVWPFARKFDDTYEGVARFW